jgi:hypothetical protein
VAGVALGAGLAPWVWETLLDCCPTDLPEPSRFAASAWMQAKLKTTAMTKERNLLFIVNSKN